MTTRDLESEMALLGSIIHDGDVIDRVDPIIGSADAFVMVSHQAVYEAACRVYRESGTLDTVMLCAALRGDRRLDEVGGEEYLIQLAESVPSSANAPYYARNVSQAATLRKQALLAEEMADAVRRGESPEAVAEIAARAASVASSQTRQDDRWDASLLDGVAESLLSGGVPGVPSGFLDLDRLTGGWKPGEFVILAARPSMGKTAIAFQFAANAAQRGYPVAFFSLEMSKQALAARLIQAKSRFIGVRAAAKVVASLPMHVEDRAGVTAAQILQRLRTMIRDDGVRVAFIDYIGLIAAERGQSPYERMSSLSKAMKNLAREANIPIVCLAQINRAAATREDNRPQLSDLRDSGQIEEDADVAMFLHREEYYHRGDAAWFHDHQDKVGQAELLVLKNRNGRAGVVKLDFEGSMATFHDRAKEDAA